LPDLASHAAQAPAKENASNCILEPGSSRDCNPGVVFTRGKFAVATRRMFGLTQPSQKFFFPDLPTNSPIYADVQAAAPFMNGRVLCPTCWLSGFSPDKPISHAELAVALVRILVAADKVKLLSPAEAEPVLARFSDATIIPPPARSYIATAVESSIIPRFPRRKLEPAATYNSFEGAVLLETVQKRYGFLHDKDRDRQNDNRNSN
jgi:hypothetical protein